MFNLTIPVCALCVEFSKLVEDVGVGEYSFTNCNNEQCVKSGKFAVVWQNLVQSFEDISKDDKHVIIRTTDPNVWSKIFVHNIIGKTFIGTQEDNSGTQYFQYDVAKRTLISKFPLCVFEKQVYSILLVLTIIIILAALTSNVINHKQKEIEYQKLDVDVPEAVVVRNQSNTQNLSLRLTRP